MSGDEVARRQLQERLLDDVELPSDVDREAMFERTFASPPGAGQDLLPPDGFFDPTPDDEGPESDVEGLFADDGEGEPADADVDLDVDLGLDLGLDADPAPDQLDTAPDADEHGPRDDLPSGDDPSTDW